MILNNVLQQNHMYKDLLPAEAYHSMFITTWIYYMILLSVL